VQHQASRWLDRRDDDADRDEAIRMVQTALISGVTPSRTWL
jgi:hypothetical protein